MLKVAVTPQEELIDRPVDGPGSDGVNLLENLA
jgi:hypothetical protein